MSRFVLPIPQSPRTSSLAIASLAMGLASFVCSFVTGLPAVVVGTIALLRIHRSVGQLTGEKLAIGGIVTGGLGTVLIGPAVLAVLLPMVQAMREVSRCNSSLHNMHQLVLGMHGYVDKHGQFPPLSGGSGASPLSWRVQILPYLGQQELYEQFRLDEPWDSDHNLALIAKMPEVFRSPCGDFPPGTTPYLAVVGPGAAFDGVTVGPRFQDFADGTTKTICLVEADRGVEWTKPEDWEFDPSHPTRGLGELHHQYRFLAAFADGHARLIQLATDPAIVKAMMTRAGHEDTPAP